MKPLYYALFGTTLVFSSELKALLEHPQMSGEFDLDAPGLDLESQYIPAPKSAYRQVRKLESRHGLWALFVLEKWFARYVPGFAL